MKSLDIGWGFEVSGSLDSEEELEFWNDNKSVGIWLDKDGIRNLIRHLENVLEESDDD
ncbi:hypothetical protein KUA24_110 [Vibrio phage HNL01]|nr:hypothetical protein KUA24_110 [Vibrio phage HNL01]